MPVDFSLIHPELVGTAKMVPSFRYTRRTLPIIRFFFGTVFLLPKIHPDIGVQTYRVPTGEAESRLRLRLYKPLKASGPIPVLVWFHGGGHLVGNLNQSDALLLKYVREVGIAVASVDYRLAPEHPFPADLDDAYGALKWVHDQAEQLGLDPQRIAVGGESAGGGLAAALAQRARDRGEVRPAFQLLIYPMLDDRTQSAPEKAEREYVVWTPASNRFAWEAYLRRSPGSDSVPPGSVPARRADLSGLPPAWIGVGTIDLFHDEDVAYARRLQACGVDCELVTVPGAFHGFDGASPRSLVAQAFYWSQVEAMKKRLVSPAS